MSIVSSYRMLQLVCLTALLGKLGLTGEVRRVSRIEQRVSEAAKLGFERAIVPASNLGGWDYPKGIQRNRCRNSK